MNSEAFREAVERVKEINDVITGLDESIRPAAFAVLRPYVDGHTNPDAREDNLPEENSKVEEIDETSSLLLDRDIVRDFLGEHHSDKPAENVKAIAALVYSRFGASGLAAQEVRDLAHEAGVTVPDRVDVTLGTARVNKKPIFQKVRSGVYRPTVHGEKYFRESFGVAKGTGRRPELRS